MGTASGLIISAPVPVAQSMGKRPKRVVDIVISRGLNLRDAPSSMASVIWLFSLIFFSPFFSMASFRNTTITIPVEAAMPKRAMKPTHTATLKL